MQEFRTETAEAIEQLANASIAGNNLVQELLATNNQLNNNLMEANRQLAEALASIAALQGGNYGGNGGRGGRGARGAGRGGRGSRGGRGGRGEARTVRLYNNDNYCHTHGYDIHPDHTGATCNTPGPNHQVTATVNDNMGGSQRNRNLVL